MSSRAACSLRVETALVPVGSSSRLLHLGLGRHVHPLPSPLPLRLACRQPSSEDVARQPPSALAAVERRRERKHAVAAGTGGRGLGGGGRHASVSGPKSQGWQGWQGAAY